MSIVPSSVHSGVCLIVNGDDFGRSPGINRGIVECHDAGILTSASLMTLWPASTAAADAAAIRPGLSVGLHVDLGEWLYADGEWKCTYLRVPLEDERAVRREVERQLRAFRRLLVRDPTHLDSHQHVHRSEPVRSILAEAAQHLGVPLRDYDPRIRYDGRFYGQTGKGEPFPDGITLSALLEIVAGLPVGITELGCHPAAADGLHSAYAKERIDELSTLCSPGLKAALAAEGIELRSFNDLLGARVDRSCCRPAEPDR
jgi:predicted glycoside hydrolase/deacetylase ChbG (UPF0249 family)